jgi:hypothetical protein
MKSRSTITPAKLDQLAARVEQVQPPERPLSAAEALAKLAPVLRKMRTRGHTLASIQAALAAEGLAVSLRSVRHALGKPVARPSARRVAADAPAEVQQQRPAE